MFLSASGQNNLSFWIAQLSKSCGCLWHEIQYASTGGKVREGEAYHIEGDVNFGAQHSGGQINLLDVDQYSRAEPNLMKSGMVFS